MDVREKLVELLAGCPCESDCEGMVGSCPHRKNGNCNEIFKLSYCAVSKLAQHLITHGVTVQEWISVNDRLPNDNDRVIAFRPNEPETSAYKYCVMWGWSVKASLKHRGITHWRPMPQPPKGE